MNEYTEAIELFRNTVSGPPDDVPLARAALLAASAEDPSLDVDAYERRLDEIAVALTQRLATASDASARARMATELLFAELGFSGDEENYDDPDNLLLHRVIDRRRGIPITLAIIYIEVCQRAGMLTSGVGLPGHVVARIDELDDEPRYVDVFRGGRPLTAEDCEQMVRETYGRHVDFKQHFLSAITPRQLLQRLLHNLKARALQSAHDERAGRTMDLQLAMYPWDLDEQRDRGMLRERLGDHPGALSDLEQYVRFRASARDIRTVSETVESLRRHINTDDA
jgi:regulator of sirC expression with transglutaminase-like and TPR domain